MNNDTDSKIVLAIRDAARVQGWPEGITITANPADLDQLYRIRPMVGPIRIETDPLMPIGQLWIHPD
jgi:hypothetical protein